MGTRANGLSPPENIPSLNRGRIPSWDLLNNSNLTIGRCSLEIGNQLKARRRVVRIDGLEDPTRGKINSGFGTKYKAAIMIVGNTALSIPKVLIAITGFGSRTGWRRMKYCGTCIRSSLSSCTFDRNLLSSH